jgi:hypothetical protein
MEEALLLLAESGVDHRQAQAVLDFVGRGYNSLDFMRTNTPVTRRSERVKKAHAQIVVAAKMKPGRGHLLPGRIPKPAKVLDRTHTIFKLDVLLKDDTKLENGVGLSVAEFTELYEVFRPAIEDGPGRNGGHYRQVKYPTDVRLYNLLRFIMSNSTHRDAEHDLNWAKSSVCEEIDHCLTQFCPALRDAVGATWPNLVERAHLIEMLPVSLRDDGILMLYCVLVYCVVSTSRGQTTTQDYTNVHV